ncbi:hypothetical protein SAMN05444320_102734 [Streptoalloteichus hindustanus]|uniref:Uncharacterized protein n=1 Tax=Streptoalloteichus hindustanus TaxID=2017 RepID=A0A1M4ZH12_STRHI|nr:hypothetical protein SAMN05444320_102734 [Streptoalloteichus hindustanus]
MDELFEEVVPREPDVVPGSITACYIAADEE